MLASSLDSGAGALSQAPGAYLWLAVLLPLAGFAVNGLLALVRPGARRLVDLVGPGVLVGSFVMMVLAVRALAAPGGPEAIEVTLWHWIATGGLDIGMTFRLDHLSGVMALVVTGVGSLIHVFSVGYMREDPGYARYFAYLNLFIVCMLVLVLASSMPVLFIGWEGVGLCSYLLIGFWFEVEANATAGKKAFLMNRIGDAGFLIAMFLAWDALGTLDFAAVAARAPGALALNGTVVTLIALCITVGCIGKSAQIPLYTWLPDAMAGPTPVSALIHAATMVTAGVYLVARTSVVFALAPTASLVVACVGAATALFAATIALRQDDIKKVLAFSTVSQLGFMFLAVGSGAWVAGIFHLVTHAFFKAVLFLGSGSVIHAMHGALHATHSHADAQDMRNMGGLRRWMPWTWGLMWIATLAIAGIPPLAGFFSKDEILASAFGRAGGAGVMYVLWGMATLASLLTAIYMARLMALTFHGTNRTGAAEQEHLHEAPWVMTAPLAVLGVLSAVGGWLNVPHALGGHAWLHGWLEPVLAPAAAILPAAMPSHATELALMGFAVLVGVVGLLIGFRGTMRREVLLPADAPPETGFRALLAAQYHVDRIYDRLVVRPLTWFSRVVLWRFFDQGVLDGVFVNGSARILQGLGWLGSRFQTGQVGLYLLLIVAGAVWALGYVLR